jgi:AcrR family transcriptional regulator
MVNIMRTSRINVRAAAKDATHERIVTVAARSIRRSGYDGTGVADIMKAAALKQGAFYARWARKRRARRPKYAAWRPATSRT